MEIRKHLPMAKNNLSRLWPWQERNSISEALNVSLGTSSNAIAYIDLTGITAPCIASSGYQRPMSAMREMLSSLARYRL